MEPKVISREDPLNALGGSAVNHLIDGQFQLNRDHVKSEEIQYPFYSVPVTVCHEDTLGIHGEAGLSPRTESNDAFIQEMLLSAVEHVKCRNGYFTRESLSSEKGTHNYLKNCGETPALRPSNVLNCTHGDIQLNHKECSRKTVNDDHLHLLNCPLDERIGRAFGEFESKEYIDYDRYNHVTPEFTSRISDEQAIDFENVDLTRELQGKRATLPQPHSLRYDHIPTATDLMHRARLPQSALVSNDDDQKTSIDDKNSPLDLTLESVNHVEKEHDSHQVPKNCLNMKIAEMLDTQPSKDNPMVEDGRKHDSQSKIDSLRPDLMQDTTNQQTGRDLIKGDHRTLNKEQGVHQTGPLNSAISLPRTLDGQRVSSRDVETTHVRDVYAQIAPQCHHVKQKAWPRVRKFLKNLEPGSLVADVGCGNGRYLSSKLQLLRVGSDTCESFLKQARGQGHEVMMADNTCLPYKDAIFDAVISIGVIHHFASVKRRIHSLSELARILAPGGQIMIYVWAFEQTHRKFESQDVLIPWVKPDSKGQIRRHFSEPERSSFSSMGSSASDDESSTPISRRRNRSLSVNGHRRSLSLNGTDLECVDCADDVVPPDNASGSQLHRPLKRFGVFDKRGSGNSIRGLRRQRSLEKSDSETEEQNQYDGIDHYGQFKQAVLKEGSPRTKWPNQLVSECRKLGKFLRSLSNSSHDQEVDFSTDKGSMLKGENFPNERSPSEYAVATINSCLSSNTHSEKRHIPMETEKPDAGISEEDIGNNTDHNALKSMDSHLLQTLDTKVIDNQGTEHLVSTEHAINSNGCSCEIHDNNNFSLVDVPTSYQNILPPNDPVVPSTVTTHFTMTNALSETPTVSLSGQTRHVDYYKDICSLDPYRPVGISTTMDCKQGASDNVISVQQEALIGSESHNVCWSNNVSSCIPLDDQSEVSSSSSETTDAGLIQSTVANSKTSEPISTDTRGSVGGALEDAVTRTFSITSVDPISDSGSTVTSSDSSRFQTSTASSPPIFYKNVRKVDVETFGDQSASIRARKPCSSSSESESTATTRTCTQDDSRTSLNSQWTTSKEDEPKLTMFYSKSNYRGGTNPPESTDTDSLFSVGPGISSKYCDNPRQSGQKTQLNLATSQCSKGGGDGLSGDLDKKQEKETSQGYHTNDYDTELGQSKRGTIKSMFMKLAGIFQSKSVQPEYTSLKTVPHTGTTDSSPGHTDDNVVEVDGNIPRLPSEVLRAQCSTVEGDQDTKEIHDNCNITANHANEEGCVAENGGFLRKFNLFKANKTDSKSTSGFIDDVTNRTAQLNIGGSLFTKNYTVDMNDLSPDMNKSFFSFSTCKVPNLYHRTDRHYQEVKRAESPEDTHGNNQLFKSDGTSPTLPSALKRPDSLDFTKKRTRDKCRRSDILGSAAMEGKTKKKVTLVETPKQLSLVEAMTLLGDGATEESIANRLDDSARVVFAEMKRLNFAIRQFPQSSLDSDDDTSAVSETTSVDSEAQKHTVSQKLFSTSGTDRTKRYGHRRRHSDSATSPKKIFKSKRGRGLVQLQKEIASSRSVMAHEGDTGGLRRENLSPKGECGQEKSVHQGEKSRITCKTVDQSGRSRNVSNNASFDDSKDSSAKKQDRESPVLSRHSCHSAKTKESKERQESTSTGKEDASCAAGWTHEKNEEQSKPKSAYSNENQTMPSQGQSSIDKGEMVKSVPDASDSGQNANLTDNKLCRYYHVFKKGELDSLITDHIPTLKITETFYDHGNWCVVAQKELCL